MKSNPQDMIKYSKIGMGALKYGKKANKFRKFKKRIPAMGKKARLLKAKRRQKGDAWTKRIAKVKEGFAKMKYVAKKGYGISRWTWKRYF